MADNDLIPSQIRNGGGGSLPAAGSGPDYRQLQSPAEIDVHGIERAASAAGSAAEQRAAALGGLFKDFENTGLSVMHTFATQAGQREGAQAGLDPNFKPKTGLQAATAYGSSYNAAAHSVYVTKTQLDLEQQLTDIESKNQGNPDGFHSAASAAVTGALKNMDPLYVPEMTNWAQSRLQAGVNRQNQQKGEDTRNTALATYQSSTPDLITGALHTAAALPGVAGDQVISKLVGDDQDKLDALVASRTITPEQAVSMHAKMVADTHNQMTGQKIDISLQPVLQAMRTNVEAADKMIVHDDPNLTPEENAVRQHEFEKDRESYVQGQTRAKVDQLGAVHQRLVNGDFGPDVEGQLHTLYKGGALSEDGLFSAMAESLRNQKANIEHEANLKLIYDVMHGQRQGPLDPKNTDQAKAVDEYFQAHISQAGNVPDQQYAAGAAEIFRQTGILPESVQSRIRIGLMSGDPVRAASAAALASKIQGVNPEADAFVSNPKLAALSTLINDNLKVGMPAKQAYTMAVNTTDVPAEVRKLRDSNYTKALQKQGANAVALQNALDSATPGMFSHSPAAPISMQAEFDNLTREFYDQTGNLSTARQIATTQLRQNWGVSSVNGQPELVKHPVPESLVPSVRADIASSAKAAGYNGDPSAIHLTPNAATDASGGRIWALTHVDPTSGITDILLDRNNRPLQYALPSGPDFAKAKAALVEQKLAAARAQRDFERSVTTDQIKGEKELSDFYLTPQGRRIEQSAAGSR